MDVSTPDPRAWVDAFLYLLRELPEWVPWLIGCFLGVFVLKFGIAPVVRAWRGR